MGKLDQPISHPPVTFAVIADPHLSTMASGTAKRFEETRYFLRSAFTDISKREIDFIVSVGDLTKDGARPDFEEFDRLLETVKPPFVAVPGNHDVPTSTTHSNRLSRSEFSTRYAPDHPTFSTNVAGMNIIGVDSTVPPEQTTREGEDGFISMDQIQRLEELLSHTSTSVVLLHHNLPDSLTGFQSYRRQKSANRGIPSPVSKSHRLTEVLTTSDHSLVITGHRHYPELKHNLNFTEIITPALCIYPQSYLLITINTEGTTIRSIPILSNSEACESFLAGLNDETQRDMVEFSAIQLSRFPLRFD